MHNAGSIRDGVGAISVSCRYIYRDGLCAHGNVASERCIGEMHCSTFAAVERPDGAPSWYARNAGTNSTCEYNLGYGIYCRKYNKFYCAGRGNCGSIDDFMRSFDAHRKKKGDGNHGNKQ